MKGRRPLTDEEIRRAEKQLGTRDRALFVLGVRTGFRISELLSLTVGSVYQLGQIVGAVSVEREHVKKQTEGRTVPLHAQARGAVAAWLDELAAQMNTDSASPPDKGKLPPATPLFPSQKPSPDGRPRPITRQQAWRAYKAAFAAVGITGKTGTHSTRKTFARRVYDKLGRDLVKTQRAMGHRSVSSTISYLECADSEVEDAILGD